MGRKASRRRRISTLEERVAHLDEIVGELREQLVDRAPASEIERLNYAFELIADRAPASEVERLNKAFEQIAERSPASEIERLNYAFEQIEQRAPATEIQRLDHAFELISQRPHPSETYLASLESERVVEVPWVVGKYRGEPRVLEVGYAFAEEHYLRLLLDLEIPFLVGIDAAISPHPPDFLSFHRVQGDLLNDCLREASFDLVLCVSTIEHIGRDNTAYGLDDGVNALPEPPDLIVMRAMARWVAPGGRLLLSVPFGRLEEHGWFLNYDRRHLEALIDASNLSVTEKSFYGWVPGGWRQVEPEELSDRGYRSHGASHAGGVALIEFERSVDMQ